MFVRDFHFDLPEDLIAQTPPPVRGSSRMMVLERATGKWTDTEFRTLPQHLRAGDLLILNDSRVLPARLFAIRARSQQTQAKSPDPSGRIEVLLTGQVEPHTWTALVRPAKKLVHGEVLIFPDSMGQPVLQAEIAATGSYGERTLRFTPHPRFLEVLDQIGHLPLPPYIHREKDALNTPEDRARYQTVYAQPACTQSANTQTAGHADSGEIVTPGSAAAPTAGLHFTPEILQELQAAGVEVQRLTLHVGLGTFQPVRAERLEDIRLHTEQYTLPAVTADAITRALQQGRRIIAAGTTTTRTLEHCAREAELAGHPRLLKSHSGATSIFLSPGARFHIVQGLLTNFHLPESTLLILVSGFLTPTGDLDRGRKLALAAYAHAVEVRYRFFSYGDCMLIL